MPVLNEEKVLNDSLSQLKLNEEDELIIVDGGSSDRTLSIAGKFTDNIFTTKTGRASVMNYGADKASGDILLFLHADCLLPKNGLGMVRETLNDKNVAAGAFLLRIDHKGTAFRIIEHVSNLRARITRLLYGDQGMFLRKDVFEKIGGFADMPLMEDIEISRRLKKEGKIIFIDHPIVASPRRWLNEGIIYTTLRDWAIASSYAFLHISPEKLIKYYREVR
jgi:rSAM/selenodomain-associated transferase 2